MHRLPSSNKMKRMITLIQIRRDEVNYLRGNGLKQYVLYRTVHAKYYAEEHAKVQAALLRYNQSISKEV